MIKLGKNLMLCLFLLSFLTACNPMRYLYNEIKDYGYIVFKTPLEHAGPGTLVGGKPDSLSLVAHPETCFPKEVDGEETGLRQEDHTTIAQKTKKITTSGGANVDLMDFLSAGNLSIGAGVGFSKVQTISLTMEGVHIHYLDSVKLTRFYRDQMDDICKEYLDHVAYITQAIKVEKLEFKFYDKTGASIGLNLGNLQDILDLDLDLDFEIENGVTLVINSPKYIGYQLGRLIRSDNGVALYRATRTRRNKYIFESLDLFSDARTEKSLIQNSPLHSPSVLEFQPLDEGLEVSGEF